jgi:hypothetical protein
MYIFMLRKLHGCIHLRNLAGIQGKARAVRAQEHDAGFADQAEADRCGGLGKEAVW